MAEYQTEALILRWRAYGEGHRLLTIYSPDRGKYTVLAKGVDRPRSKLAAGCQPFMHSRLVCWKGRSLDGVRQADVVRSFRRLREDLEAMAAASYISEVVDLFLQQADPDPAFFGFLLGAFTVLEGSEDTELAVRYVEWQLLDRVGFRPVLDQCVNCGVQLEEGSTGWHFHRAKGGVLCATCGADTIEPRISAGAARSLHELLRIHPARLHVLVLGPATRRELSSLSETYLESILEKTVKARDFMEKLFETNET